MKHPEQEPLKTLKELEFYFYLGNYTIIYFTFLKIRKIRYRMNKEIYENPMFGIDIACNSEGSIVKIGDEIKL